jgi:hypothetical protein
VKPVVCVTVIRYAEDETVINTKKIETSQKQARQHKIIFVFHLLRFSLSFDHPNKMSTSTGAGGPESKMICDS